MIEVEKESRSMEGRIIRIRFSSWIIDNSKNANHQDENIKSIREIVKFLDSHLEIFQEFRISKFETDNNVSFKLCDREI